MLTRLQGVAPSHVGNLARVFAIVVLLSLLVAAVLTEVVLYARNAPIVHPDWVSGKRLVSGSLMGSVIGSQTRNYLHGNRLNLHEWHGFNEFLFDRIFELGMLRFRFFLDDEAYLIVEFNRDEESFSGIRLSRNPRFPSIVFHAAADGRFLDKRPLGDLALDGAWHDFTLRFAPNGARLILDDAPVARLAENAQAERIVGFRSGRRPAVVDDVEITSADGRVIAREDFRNHRGYAVSFVLCFVAALGISFAAYALARRFGVDDKKVLFSSIAALLVTVAVLGMYFAFDFFYWSKKYYYVWTPRFVAARPEQAFLERTRNCAFTRFPFFDADWNALLAREPQQLLAFLAIDPGTDNELSVIRGPVAQPAIDSLDSNQQSIAAYVARTSLDTSIRVLLLGTSQTWGEGALRRSDRLAVQLHHELAESLGDATPITVINASKKGSQAKDLLARFQDHLHLFRPHLVVVNLSNNDPQPDPAGGQPGFAGPLAAIVKQSRSIGARTLFVLEPNSTEIPPWIETNHTIMRSVAEQQGVPWFDLQARLAADSVYDSGILWWDQVHLTSYGQSRAAEFIAEAILGTFKIASDPRHVNLRDAVTLHSGR